MSDPFADIRDKRMSQLDAEQRDRSSELWCRNNIGYINEHNRPQVEALLRVIDRLRGTLGKTQTALGHMVYENNKGRWEPAIQEGADVTDEVGEAMAAMPKELKQ